MVSARTRSRGSSTTAPGGATRLKTGRPLRAWPSTVTNGASRPARPRDSTTASPQVRSMPATRACRSRMRSIPGSAARSPSAGRRFAPRKSRLPCARRVRRRLHGARKRFGGGPDIQIVDREVAKRDNPHQPPFMIRHGQAPGRMFRHQVKRTDGWAGSADAANARDDPSLNDLVRALQQRLRDGDAEHLRGLQVDRELELRRLLDREIGGLRALENLVDEAGRCAPMPGDG
jgi:hypothetical protein